MYYDKISDINDCEFKSQSDWSSVILNCVCFTLHRVRTPWMHTAQWWADESFFSEIYSLIFRLFRSSFLTFFLLLAENSRSLNVCTLINCAHFQICLFGFSANTNKLPWSKFVLGLGASASFSLISNSCGFEKNCSELISALSLILQEWNFGLIHCKCE